jgi:hypothetical protein
LSIFPLKSSYNQPFFLTCSNDAPSLHSYSYLIRYLVNEENAYIRSVEAHKTVASTCLSYLCFNCFNEDSEIDFFIWRGEYVLQEYACSNWLDHLQNGIEGSVDADKDLAALLGHFIRLRWSAKFADADTGRYHPSVKLRTLEASWPDIYEALRKILVFRHRKADPLNYSGSALHILQY